MKFTHLCQVGSSPGIGPFPVAGVSGRFLPCFVEFPAFYANSGNPDLTPRTAASDQGLYCLPMSLFYGTVGLFVLLQVLLNPDKPCFCKQCRSRSVDF